MVFAGKKNEIHFLPKNGQKMVYYMVKRILRMSIFWYFFVLFFEKDDIVVYFQFFCVKMSSKFGKFGAWYWQNVGRYSRVFSKKIHFLPKNGQQMVYMVNRILGMSIFWYFLGVMRRPKWCYHTYSIIVFGWVTWISLSISHFLAE